MPVSLISVGFLVGDEGVRVVVVVVNSDVAVLRILTLVVRSSLEELSTFASLAVTLFAESLGLGWRRLLVDARVLCDQCFCNLVKVTNV